MKQSVITGLFFLLSVLGFSQGEWNNWYFGWYAAMKFDNGTPVGVTGSALTSSGGSCSTTVSDSAGTLLFYANGWKIWNRNNVVMPNGSGLIGGNLCQQPVFSAPIPGYANRYYVFTVGDPSTPDPPIGLHYSVVDMSLQGGLGDVISIQKNIYVPGGDSAVDQLTGTRGHNNKDIWIVVRKHTPVTHYLAYHIDALGLNTIPVVSPTTMNARFRWQFGNLVTMRGGDMKISYDGKFLVCHDSLTEICRFNDTTGVVTPLFKVYIDVNICGAEFSIDSKYLYVSTRGSAIPNQCHLYQFDMGYLDSLSFMQHKVLIGYGTALKLQMGPNWKIYTNLYNGLIDSLNCINYPSLPYPACNYQRNVVCLLGNGNNGCLVQFLQRYKAHLHHSSAQCQNDSISFSNDIWPPADSIHWDFGDPASGSSNFSNLASPSHLFSGPGNYIVELWVRHIDKRTDTTWQVVAILPSPQPELGPDKTICIGDSITFDAGLCSGCTYLWKDVGTGLTVGTSQTFKTGLAGTYSVNVTNLDGCIGSDTVQLITTAVPSVTNNPLSTTICSGESTNIALTSSIPGTNFHWTASLTSGNITGFSADSGLVINQVLSNSLPTPGIVTYQITPNVGSCAGTPVDFQVTVNPGDSVKVTIIASANNICAGTSVTFTATPANGGANPAYQWKVNGTDAGSNSPVYTYTPVSGDQVLCILTSSNTICTANNPATSNTITMIVNPILPVSISVVASQNPVCTGTSVTFTATPINCGNSPQYQWKVNGLNTGTNSPGFTYVPANNDLVSCILTCSEPCTTNNPATGNTVAMTVTENLPAGVSIVASSNPFCPGKPVTFTATPVNGGSIPVYQWKVNGTNAGTNLPAFTYNPVNNDSVRCIMTSSLTCVTGNPASSATIIMSGTLAPVVTFTRCFDSVTTINAKPFTLKGGLPLGGIYSGPGVNTLAGVFTPSAAGVGLKTITYTYTNAALCSAQSTVTIVTLNASPFTCGNNLTDIRDGKVYRTIQVGSKCWMGSNLNYGTWIHSSTHQTDNCIVEKYCPDDLQANCQWGTAAYQWDELVQYGITAAPDYQGVCPPGWHIPSAAEFQTLIDTNQGSSLAGTFLTDLYLIPRGFEALLQGMAYLNTAWAFTSSDNPSGTFFWTSTPGSGNKIITRGVNNRKQSVSLYESSKANAFPLRCLKD